MPNKPADTPTPFEQAIAQLQNDVLALRQAVQHLAHTAVAEDDERVVMELLGREPGEEG
jgi:hypothetical protein